MSEEAKAGCFIVTWAVCMSIRSLINVAMAKEHESLVDTVRHVLRKEEKPTEHINLKVLGQDGQVVHFKIKKHTSLKKLINAYCERSKLVQTTVRFRFDGQPISENDTPQGLEMEDGDTIEVFQQQTGGYYHHHLPQL